MIDTKHYFLEEYLLNRQTMVDHVAYKKEALRLWYLCCPQDIPVPVPAIPEVPAKISELVSHMCISPKKPKKLTGQQLQDIRDNAAFLESIEANRKLKAEGALIDKSIREEKQAKLLQDGQKLRRKLKHGLARPTPATFEQWRARMDETNAYIESLGAGLHLHSYIGSPQADRDIHALFLSMPDSL